MHVIDEEGASSAELCVTWCPERRSPASVPAWLAIVHVDRVYVDPEACIDCGTCMTEGRMSPSEAIYDAATGLPDRASADGAKYSKYIYDYDFESDEYYVRWRPPAPAEGSDEPAAETRSRNCRGSGYSRLNTDAMPGNNLYVADWVLPHEDSMPGVGHPPHVHKDAELIWVIGGDREHPKELGAKIEVYLGPEMERHIINQSCVLYIRPYFMDCPWRILRTTKPWNLHGGEPGPKAHGEDVQETPAPRGGGTGPVAGLLQGRRI